MGRDAKRKRLFNSFSKNLFRVLHDRGLGVFYGPKGLGTRIYEDAYCCPLCLHLFDKSAIEEPNLKLTLEHVPPDSVGGSVKMLTCRNCNSQSGSDLDFSLKESLKTDAFFNLEKGSGISSKFKFDGFGSIRGHIKALENKKLQIDLNPSSNPHFFSRIENQIIGGDSVKFNFSFKAPHPNIVKIACFRSAFLEAFHYFGYSFIFDGNIQEVKERVLNKKEEFAPGFGVVDHEFGDEFLGLNLIRQPKHLSCYLIIFKIKFGNHKRNVGVLLPGPYKEGLKNLANYHEVNNKNLTLTITNFGHFMIPRFS